MGRGILITLCGDRCGMKFTLFSLEMVDGHCKSTQSLSRLELVINQSIWFLYELICKAAEGDKMEVHLLGSINLRFIFSGRGASLNEAQHGGSGGYFIDPSRHDWILSLGRAILWPDGFRSRPSYRTASRWRNQIRMKQSPLSVPPNGTSRPLMCRSVSPRQPAWNQHQRQQWALSPGLHVILVNNDIIRLKCRESWSQWAHKRTQVTKVGGAINWCWRAQNRPIEMSTNKCWLINSSSTRSALALKTT